MSRLYDRILASKEIPDAVKDVVRKSVYFVGDNVAAYYYTGTEQEYWDRKDFPNVTPPAQNFFVDFKPPKKIVSEKHGIVMWESSDRPRTWGIHNLVLDTKELSPDLFLGWSKFFVGEEDNAEQILKTTKHDIRWVVESCLFVELEKDKPLMAWAWQWFVSPDGELVDPLDTGKGLIAINVPKRLMGLPIPPEIEMEMAKGVLPLLHCQWLFISFFHTKNTNMVNVEPPIQLKKKSLRKRGYPVHGYRVLEIEPLKQVLETEGRAKEVGLQRALHICRGHFRDYRKRGLFGKHKGIFWFEAHLRGGRKKENG